LFFWTGDFSKNFSCDFFYFSDIFLENFIFYVFLKLKKLAIFGGQIKFA